MSLESSEVVVAGTGHVWRAPVNTAFPADISVAVPEVSWTELGYTDINGVKFTMGRDIQEIPAWQSVDPLRVIIKATPRTMAHTFLQFNQNTWNTAMGGGTWSSPGAGKGLYVPPDPSVPDQFAEIVEWSDGANKYRFCARKVMVEDPISFTLARTDAIMLPITVKILAADNGANPFDFQTNDANMYDATQAGS